MGLDGANINGIFKVGSTWGTAVTGGARNKMIFDSFNMKANPAILEDNSCGLGVPMPTDSQQGLQNPSGQCTFKGGYGDCFPQIVAQFMQAAAAGVEQTVGQGDYMHRITYTRPIPSSRKPGTIAIDKTASIVHEAPSVDFTSLRIKAGGGKGYLMVTGDFMANKLLFTGTENESADTAAATLGAGGRIVFDQDDKFLINLTGGSGLANPTDRIAITDFDLQLTDPKKFVGEIKGALGMSEPQYSGQFMGTLSITLKSMDDNTFFTAFDASTAYKCSLNIQGAAIASGVNHAFTSYIPYMIPLVDPDNAISSPGINPLTVQFYIMKTSANPTGMNSTMPYFEFINTYNGDYI